MIYHILYIKVHPVVPQRGEAWQHQGNQVALCTLTFDDGAGGNDEYL